MTMDTIPFLVRAPSDSASDTRGLFRKSQEIVGKRIPVDALKTNLQSVSQSVMTILQDIKQVGDFRLKEVTFHVEVSAEGGVELIGTASVGGKGAVSLKFSE